MYCGICGNLIKEGEENCSNCGAPVPGKKDAPVPTFEPAQPLGEMPAASYMPQQNAPGYQQPYPQYYQYPPYQQPMVQPAGKKAVPWFVWVIIGIYVIGMITPYLISLPTVFSFRKRAKVSLANSQAQTAFYAIKDYADQENDDSVFSIETAKKAVEFGEIDCEAVKNEEGVVGKIASSVCQNRSRDNGGYILVFLDSDSLYGYVIQWREKAGDNIIGQYPSPTDWSDIDSGRVRWGEYYDPDNSSYDYGYDHYDDPYDDYEDYEDVNARPRESVYEKCREV